ncbi:TFIIB zinc-binding-like protein [Schistosoma japonicum]|nr:TFIIB zinc-binding-like protein [Schistosoma japonicum]
MYSPIYIFLEIMSCPICENRQLVEDENTGQLVCTECGTATGVFRGVTQSQDFTETRGLRVIQKAEIISSQSNQTTTDNLPGTSRYVKVEPDSTCFHNMNPEYRGSLLDTLDDPFNVNAVICTNTIQQEKSFEKHRPWRLSEPFTFIMKHQANCLAKELNLSLERKLIFCDTIWKIWLHYLSITGELGTDAWLRAASLLVKSTCEVFKNKTVTPKEENHTNKIVQKYELLNDYSTTNQYENEWEFLKIRLSRFQWVGWGMLYEPDEGREIINILHMSRKKTSRKAKKCNEKSLGFKMRRRKRNIDNESSDDSDSVLFDKNPHDTLFCLYPRIESHFEDSEIHKPDMSCQNDIRNECTQETLSPYFAKKLSRSHSLSHLLWRGQIEGGFNCRALMEHNIAVLFIACLTTCPVRKAVSPLFSSHFINPDFPNIPYALTTMITMKDLQDLCIYHRLPFTSAESLFPPNVFSIRDQSLLNLIRRQRPPEIDHLTYAAVRMREFIGLNQFPKYPLSWLVHRHITSLGLPDVMHAFVRPLLDRLQRKCIPINQYIHRPLLHLIPWPRVVRPEVFAMALVIILLRLVFKFDDVFEHRLSSVAKALELFRDRTIGSTQTCSISLYDRPFVWISWVQYIDSRFHPSYKTNFLSSKNDQNPCSNARVHESNQPLILTASRGSELLDLEKASDLLGSTEFEAGHGSGWGEKSIKKIKVADSQWKNRNRSRQPLVLPKPVEEFIAKHNENLSKTLDSSNELIHDKQDKNRSTTKGLSEFNNVHNPQNSRAQEPVCMHCRSPSKSIKWLVNVCAMICGASSIKSLLTEIECLERLLKWHTKASCSVSTLGNEARQVDFALLSFFDLSFDFHETSVVYPENL